MDVAGEALADMKDDLDYFLKSAEERDIEEAQKKKEKKVSDDINPFMALFGLFKKSGVKKAVKKDFVEPEDIKKDNFVEKTMRSEAIKGAADSLFTIYDIYKAAHSMTRPPRNFDNYDIGAVEKLRDGGKVGIKDIFRGRGD